jgi:hypothetical protein
MKLTIEYTESVRKKINKKDLSVLGALSSKEKIILE